MSGVDVLNNQLIIDGTNLDSATSVRVTGPAGFDETFAIESQSSNQLIANSLSNITMLVNGLFSLIVSNAEGAATYTITFDLQDGQVTAAKLSDMGAVAGEVLTYDGSTWGPAPLSGLSYKGTFDATGGDQTTTTAAAGHYYIVTNAGSNDPDGLSSGNSFSVGDWAVYNGTTSSWNRVIGSNAVVSVAGKTGVVTLSWADFSKTGSLLSDIANIDVAGRADGDILIWNNTTSNWEVGQRTTDTNTNAITECGAGQVLLGDGSCSTYVADSNASTLCASGEYLDGSGSCLPIPVDTNTNAGTICTTGEFLNGDGACETIPVDTNAGTICTTGEFLNGDGACQAIPVDTNTTYTAGTGLDLTGTVFSIPAQAVTNTMINGIATNCSSGEVLKADGTGGFTCATDAGGSDATSLRGENLDPNLAVDTIADNQILVWSQTNNQWEVSALPADNDTTYSAGTGLTLSTTTFNVDAGTGPNQIVQLDGSSRLPAVDGSQLTNVSASSVPVQNITSSATNYFGYQPNGASCADGQVLEWNGAQGWVCGTKTVDSDTTYTAGTGLTLTGTTFDVDIDTTTTLGTSDVVVPSQNAVKTYVDSATGAITSSQWITTGSDIYYNTGDVGIGNTAPGAGLHLTRKVGSSQSMILEGDTSVTGAPKITFRDSNGGATDADLSFDQASGFSFTGGNLGVGTTSPSFTLHAIAGIGNDRYTDGAPGAHYFMRKARGTEASPTVVNNGDEISTLWGQAYDGNSFETAARIKFLVDGIPGDGDMPGRIDFTTTPDGSTVEQTRMVIRESGRIGIGTVSPAVELDVNTGVINASAICDENNANCIDLSTGVAGSGEANTASSLGGSVSLVGTKSGVNLPFRGLSSSNSTVSLTQNANDIDLTVDVPGTVLSGFATGADTSVVNTDTVEVAIEKLQGQISGNDTAIAGIPSIGTGAGNVMGADAVPNCAAGQKLQMSLGPVYSWSCVSESADGHSLDAADGAPTDVVFVDNDGRVGIGTTTPSKILDIVSPNNFDGIRVNAGSTANGVVGLTIQNSDLAGDYGLGVYGSGSGVNPNAFYIYDNNASQQRLVIDSTGNLGVGTASPNATSLLELSSTTKGFLPPRMTEVQRDAIATPAQGLIIYNTTTNKLNMYDSSSWTEISAGGTLSNLPGFRATLSANQSIGVGTFRVNVDNEIYDNNGEFDNATNHRFTVTKAGFYTFSGWASMSSLQNTAAVTSIYIYKNGSSIIGENEVAQSGYTSVTRSIAVVDKAEVGDYYELYIFSNDTSGGNVVVAGASFSGAYVGGLTFGGGSGGALTADSVTSAEIADNAVTSSEISDGSVTGTDIGSDTVTVANVDFASTNGINIPQLAADPGSGVAGQQYYNTTTNQMMVYNGTSWVSLASSQQVNFTVAATAGQSIPNATWTKVNFNVEETDEGGGFDISTDRFQPTTAGYYYIHADILYVATSGWNNPYVRILKNGTISKASLASGHTTSQYPNVKISSLVYLNGSTDYIEIETLQSSGAALSLYTSTQYTNAYGFLVSGGAGGSGSSEASSIISAASDPSSPSAGQVYFNTTTNKLMLFDGSSWVEVGSQNSSTGGFGARTNLSLGTIFGPATTDGLVVVNGRHDGAGGVMTVSVNADTSATPTTEVARGYSYNNGTTYLGSIQLTAPIKKGEYYRILCNGNTTCGGASFIGGFNAYFISGISGGDSQALSDLDDDTKIQVESTTDEDKIRFSTTGVERMIISETGNIGIGTSTPSTSLDVNGTVTATSFVGSGASLTNISTSSISNDSITLDKVDFASTDGINIPSLASDPVSPTAGQQYYNTTTNKMMYYDGSSWKQLDNGSTTSALFNGWPDAIVCTQDADASTPDQPRIFWFSGNYSQGDDRLYYKLVDDAATLRYLIFNSNQTWSNHTNATPYSTCLSKSISTLISEGKAKYFGNDIATVNSDDDGDTKIMTEKSTDEDKIRFDTAGVERMVLDQNGNLGIGNSTPNFSVDVARNQDSSTYIKVGNINDTASARAGFYATTSTGTGISMAVHPPNYTAVANWANRGTVGVDSAFDGLSLTAGGATSDIRFETGGIGSERMRIASNGSVGIGTTSPAAELHIARDDASNPGLRISNDSNVARVYLGDPGGTDIGALKLYNSAGTETVSLLATGNSYLNTGDVGIGTSTPQAKLDVNGNIRINGDLQNGTSTLNKVIISSIPEATAYQRFKVTVGAIRTEAILELKIVFRSSGGIGTSVSHGIFEVGRTDGGATVRTLQLINSGTDYLLTPEISGNDIIWGLQGHNNGTGTTYNVVIDAKLAANNTNNFTLAEVTGTTAAGGTAYRNYVNNGDRVISSNGSFGIGTLSPQYKLHIVGDNGSDFMLSGTADDGPNIRMGNSANNIWSFDAYGPTNSRFRLITEGGASGNVERVSVTEDGKVGIGEVGPTEKLDVAGQIRLDTLLWMDGAGGFKGGLKYYGSPSGGFGFVNATDSDFVPLTVQSLTQTSDINLKERITPIESALEKVTQLKGVEYFWRNPDSPQEKQIGLIAQNVQEVFPEVVSQAGTGVLSVSYPNLIAPVIEAIKELDAMLGIEYQNNLKMAETMAGLENLIRENSRAIASLEEKVEILEEENRNLKEENTKLEERLKKIEALLGL